MACQTCEKTFHVPPARAGTAKYCSRHCLGKAHSAQVAIRGFQKTNNPPRRYKTVKVNGRAVYEHRYVMESHLGRPLSFADKVHHINGDTLDNRIENLQVTTQREHSRLEWERHSTRPAS